MECFQLDCKLKWPIYQTGLIRLLTDLHKNLSDFKFPLEIVATSCAVKIEHPVKKII